MTAQPPPPRFDGNDLMVIRDIAHHYFRYREYEKSLDLLLLLHACESEKSEATISDIIEAAYRSRKIDIYFRFMDQRMADNPKQVNLAHYALYCLLRGDVKRAVTVFRRYVG